MVKLTYQRGNQLTLLLKKVKCVQAETTGRRGLITVELLSTTSNLTHLSNQTHESCRTYVRLGTQAEINHKEQKEEWRRIEDLWSKTTWALTATLCKVLALETKSKVNTQRRTETSRQTTLESQVLQFQDKKDEQASNLNFLQVIKEGSSL